MRVLLPHEVLAAMAESQHYVFESVLLGHLPDDARKAFWKHVSGLEPWKHHPVINQGSWERLVGIHIHGDGCEFYKEDEYFVWSWSSIFATAGSIKDVLMFRFPIAVIPERWMRTASATHLIIVVCTGFPIYFKLCDHMNIVKKKKNFPCRHPHRFVTRCTRRSQSSQLGPWSTQVVGLGLRQALKGKNSIQKPHGSNAREASWPKGGGALQFLLNEV